MSTEFGKTVILSWDLYNFIIDEVQERLFISGTAFEV